MGSLSRGFGARLLLATLGGLAAMMSGATGQRYAEPKTLSRVHRSRIAGKAGKSAGKAHNITGRSPTEQGRILKSHFDQKGTCMSAKRGKLRLAYGAQYI